MSRASEVPVALVTGASRGLGKAIALSLAEAGFDVAVTARTVTEGDGSAEDDTVNGAPPVPLAGSLATTVAEIERRGRRGLGVAMDFRDLATVEAVPRVVLDAWGRIDVLVNNGLYRGPGTSDRLLDLRMDDLDTLLRGNVSHQIRLVQLVVPSMLEHGRGRIIDIVSGSARQDPPGPPGTGGWGIAYSGSKAALGRLAGGVNAEFAASGIQAFNVDPGNVLTERRRALRPHDEYTAAFGLDSADATAGVVAWLASDPPRRRVARPLGARPCAVGRAHGGPCPCARRDRRRPLRGRFAEPPRRRTATGDR